MPLTHQCDDFELCLLRGQREQHCAVQQIRRERRNVIGAPNTDHGLANIVQVVQISEHEFGAGVFQGLRAAIPTAYECAYRESVPEKFQYRDRAGVPGR